MRSVAQFDFNITDSILAGVACQTAYTVCQSPQGCREADMLSANGVFVHKNAYKHNIIVLSGLGHGKKTIEED